MTLLTNGSFDGDTWRRTLSGEVYSEIDVPIGWTAISHSPSTVTWIRRRCRDRQTNDTIQEWSATYGEAASARDGAEQHADRKQIRANARDIGDSLCGPPAVHGKR
jgi:hypothetical protein